MKTVKEIADYIGAELIGNPLAEVTENDIAFITHPSGLEKTKASVVIAPEKLDTSKILLISKNPKLSFAKVLELFQRPASSKAGQNERAWIEDGAEIDPSSTIYPFAAVRRGAKIGKNVILYPGVYVGEEVSIDDNCILYPNVTILPRTKIGKRVLIHAGAVLGDDGFGYVWDGTKHYKIPQIGKVVIEDDVEIGANTAIDRATRGETRIKIGTKIDNLVQIGHNCNIGSHSILCGQVGIGGSATIGDGTILGGQSGIADHITIGAQSQIAAQSGVIRNLEPKEIVCGFPAIPAYQFFKTVSLLRKLPEMYKTIQELQKKIEELKI